MWLPFKVLFGRKAEVFFTFKERAIGLGPLEMRRIYEDVAHVFISRETDLNKQCIAAIEELVIGDSVLDIACGRGFLAKRLAKKLCVTAADFIVDKQLAEGNSHIRFCRADLAGLPFVDNGFDTVICCHTLEHLQRPEHAINELRRVCAKRLIIVLPRQRPYRYTFDLHLRFFPYRHDVYDLVGKVEKRQQCELLGGDWLYVEG